MLEPVLWGNSANHRVTVLITRLLHQPTAIIEG